MQEMTTWGNICRICTSPAEYELFEKIPAYLHATSNEFLNWQQSINVLLEETTGLKISPEDGLPSKICALCISYLKHAVTFRQQCINNTLGLKAVEVLRQRHKSNNSNSKNHADKESLLITAQELNFTEERQIDANLLNSNCQQEQDKVCKQLLNNNFQATAPTQQNVEQQLRYLNLLFGKDTNAGIRPKHRNISASAGFEAAAGNGGDPYAEEDFQTATSSDENETGSAVQKHNIFSYKEKNFEEDDVMDMDELRDAITISIPESCKERKCRACFRRFMFEESYNEHMDSCIEYKFLTYIEEINRLLDIRRSKGISPHEFIRRMIFCLRKTCEWLKKANCGDMLLPDLVPNGSGVNANNKQHLESEGKSSAASSGEQKAQPVEDISEKLRKRFDIPKEDKMTDFMQTTKPNDNILLATSTNRDCDFNLENNLIDLFKTPKPHKSGTTTPISINNNILYEIERSQSRNSNNQNNLELGGNTPLKKPIAVLASTTTTTTCTATFNGVAMNDNVERLTFLQKLQQAASQTPPASGATNKTKLTTPRTPLISVRKDLLHGASVTTASNESNKAKSIPVPITPIQTNLTFSARCNPCNLLFETLAALEVHNAMHHNHMPVTQAPTHPSQVVMPTVSIDDERKRIIALFEDDEAENI